MSPRGVPKDVDLSGDHPEISVEKRLSIKQVRSDANYITYKAINELAKCLRQDVDIDIKTIKYINAALLAAAGRVGGMKKPGAHEARLVRKIRLMKELLEQTLKIYEAGERQVDRCIKREQAAKLDELLERTEKDLDARAD
jgi:hypothetical protein